MKKTERICLYQTAITSCYNALNILQIQDCSLTSIHMQKAMRNLEKAIDCLEKEIKP